MQQFDLIDHVLLASFESGLRRRTTRILLCMDAIQKQITGSLRV